MKNTEFVHLHNHTEYSILDSTIRLKKMFEKVNKLGMNAIAMTDHCNMFGAIAFYTDALSCGIKPIIGCEINLIVGLQQNDFHVTLLCKNEKGYKNLLKLVSTAWHVNGTIKTFIDMDMLSQYSDGLICLSGCIKGILADLILRGESNRVEKKILEFNAIFGIGNYYLELMDHGTKEEHIVNSMLVDLSKKFNIPVVATNNCHYISKEDAEAHDALLCIKEKAVFKDDKRSKFPGSMYYIKSSKEMEKLFESVPDAVRNTRKIAEECNLNLNLGGFILPDFKIPPEFKNLNEYLDKVVYEGMKRRFGENPSQIVKERVRYELEIIKKLNYAGYFLILWDIIQYKMDKNILVGPGRGSVTGSMVAYCLGITEVDPIKYDLVFERFMNPDRTNPPDINLDFECERRDEIIKYINAKYGKDHVAQIVIFGELKRKAAISAVGRVMELNYNKVNKLIKMIPYSYDSEFSLQNVLKENKKACEMIKKDTKFKKLIEIACKLEGITAYTSMHAAAIVISKDALTNYVPICKDGKEDELVLTQYERGDIERIGLLNLDFLALNALTLIKKTIEKIEKNYDKNIEINKIPLDDKKTFNLICKGDTDGVFQLTGSGMRDIIQKLKPNMIQDIIALIAIYRPGPMEWIDEFIKRKQGIIPIKYTHPIIEEILKETYGVMLYQEQIMQIAVEVAGFSVAQADFFRKAMLRKEPKIMKMQKRLFIKSAGNKGIPESKAKNIYDDLAKFAGYTFNKAHAVAYALISYQTAYLKANYPKEFKESLNSTIL